MELRAGWIRGTVLEKVTAQRRFRGRTRHASPEAPQHVLRSERTGHVAMHKGTALRKARSPRR